MDSSRDAVLRLLDEYARRTKPLGPLALSEGYLKCVDAWQSLPENAERTDKSWVLRASRSWRQSILRARLVG